MKHTSKITAIILIGWLVLNTVQSIFTELIHDEAYYWMFSQNLDWGYFEQPPMVAFFVATGNWFFSNELGVRLVFIFGSTLGLWLMWMLTDTKHPITFFGIALSVSLVHLGFLAVPDTAFLFFVCLFFYLAKKYLEKNSWWIATLLGLTVAALAYSKYHASVLLLFALLSNLHLLRRPSFWMIPVLATVCYIPHIQWQVLNDFPPIQYHLRDRLTEPYSVLFCLNYVGSQFLLFGPFISFLLFWALLKFRAVSGFDRMMKWTAFGIFGFFLALSFIGRVEANWTTAALVPVLYIGYKTLSDDPGKNNLIKGIAVGSMGIFLITRLYLAINFIPGNILPRNEIHNWDDWAGNISKVAGDLPVIFNNNYQRTSKYQFYSGKQAHSVNTVSYAGNQYDLFVNAEESLNGKPVLHISEWIGGRDTIYTKGLKPAAYKIVPELYYNNRVKLQYEIPQKQLLPDTKYTVNTRLVNPTSKVVHFNLKNVRSGICFHWYEYRIPVLDGPATDKIPVDSLSPGEGIDIDLVMKTPKASGDYRFRFAIQTGSHHGRNAIFSKVKITETEQGMQ